MTFFKSTMKQRQNIVLNHDFQQMAMMKFWENWYALQR